MRALDYPLWMSVAQKMVEKMNTTTKHCMSCGSRNIGPFIGRKMVVRCRHIEKTVAGLSGYECREPDCDGFDFMGDGGKQYSQASDDVIAAYQAEITGKYRQALDVLCLKRKEVIPGRLIALLASGDQRVLDAAAFLLEMLVNDSAWIGKILKAGG